MISVLVLANESLFADAIVAVLSQEIDLDVVRKTHHELGKGGHYSVVILIEEEEIESESLRLKDLIRENVTLILIKVSLESRNVHVFESYQLLNPEMDQVLNLLKTFSRRYLKNQSDEDTGSQKKMNESFLIQIGEQIRNRSCFPAAIFSADALVLNLEN